MRNKFSLVCWALPGIVLFIVGLAADVITGGPAGFGVRQIAVCLTGAVVSVIGLLLALRPKWRRPAFSVCVAIGCAAVLEGAAWITLVQRDTPTNAFLLSWPQRPRQRQMGKADQRITLSFLDPHLGYAHNPQTLSEFSGHPGFAVYGDPSSTSALRIVTLGGSTTDAVSIPEGNWPRQLFEILNREGVDCVVHNGGVGGFSSNQELLKLIRDGLPLRPDIVISLNGLNDLGFMHGVEQHPMVNPYQRALLDSMARPGFALFPNLVRLLTPAAAGSIEGVHLGVTVDVSDVEQWWKNVRLARAITREYGAEYLCCLQPALGYSQYGMSPEEVAMLSRHPDDYLPTVKSFYDAARPLIASVPHGLDLVDVHHCAEQVYIDSRHVDAEGNRLIAQAIADHLEAAGMLNRRSDITGCRQPVSRSADDLEGTRRVTVGVLDKSSSPP